MSDQHWTVTTVPREDAPALARLMPDGFVVALFDRPVTACRLADIVGDPFADEEQA